MKKLIPITLLLLTCYGCKKDQVLNPGMTAIKMHTRTLDEIKKPPPPNPNDPKKDLASGD